MCPSDITMYPTYGACCFISLTFHFHFLRINKETKNVYNVIMKQSNIHRETIAAISDWPQLFHDANLSSAIAENRAVYLGLNTN